MSGSCNEEVSKCVRTPGDLLRVENAFGKPREESQGAAFTHLATRAEERGSGRNHPTDSQQIVFVAARAVQKSSGGAAGSEPGSNT
jgi:hypothetical protein